MPISFLFMFLTTSSRAEEKHAKKEEKYEEKQLKQAEKELKKLEKEESKAEKVSSSPAILQPLLMPPSRRITKKP